MLAFAGCAHVKYEPQPLSPAQTAAAFDARSLADPGLRRFLGESLNRDFSGASTSTWDFETLAWVAFYFNPTLEVARAQWETVRASMRTAGARSNPTLGLTPGYSTNPGAGISPWFPAVTLDFPIETAGKRQHRATEAEQKTEAARQAVFTAAWKIRSDLRHALLDFTVAQRRVKQLRAETTLEQHSVILLEQRLNAGAISAGEVATARLAAVRAEAQAADAERQIPIALQRVAAVLGLPASALAGVSLPTPPVVMLSPDQLATARKQSLQSRPDILAALARYSASESALALEIARQFPDLHLGPGYQWDQGQNKWSVGLSFELPLFNHNEGPIAEAVARRREAAAQFLAVQAQALAEIDGAASGQSAAAAQLETLRRVQSQLEQQRVRVVVRQRAGAGDQLETDRAGLEVEIGSLALTDAETQIALATGQLEDALQIPFAHLSNIEKSAAAAMSPSMP